MSLSVLLVCDFDGTLTQRDTSYLSFKSTEKFREAHANNQMELLHMWEKEGQQYYSGYLKCVDTCLDKCKSDNDFSYKTLETMIKTLDTYNINSRHLLASKNYFNDIVGDKLEKLVEEIEFYPNAIESLKVLREKNNIMCKILSINWFPELLIAALDGIIAPVDITSSAIPLYQNGTIDFGKVSTACGKCNWIKQWRSQHLLPVIYIGDSLTDLLALLEANYGIIFGSNVSLTNVASLFHVDVIPLAILVKNNDHADMQKNSTKKCLYSTQCWKEITKFISLL